MKLYTFKNTDGVFNALSDRLAAQVETLQRPFHLALSGGSTAIGMFRRWRTVYRDRIDWEKVRFYWVDERCVPPADEQSNYKHADEELFRPLSIPAGHIHRMRGEAPPEEEAIRYGRLLQKELPESGDEPRFDAIILGIGEDGHTASIFPNQTALLTDPGPCAVGVHPSSGQKRITLTGPVLLNASQIYVPVTGSGKRPMLERILGDPPKAIAIDASLPAGYILSRARHSRLYTDSLG